MPDEGKTLSDRRGLLFGVLACALFLRLVIAWSPIDFLLRYVLADDSFYYLTIARNFAQGAGCTFDRIAPTNGFHPLWLVVLLPIYKAVNDPLPAIHTVLTVCALIDTLSILILARILSLLNISLRSSFLIIGLFVLTPSLLSHAGTMNGLETSLNVFLIFSYLFLYVREITLPQKDGNFAILSGLTAGMLILTRTDNAILVAVTAIHICILRKHHRRAIGPCALSAAIVILVSLPWVVWSLSNFGTVVQVSGVSTAFMLRESVYSHGWTFLDVAVQIFRNLANTLTFFPFYQHDTRIFSVAGMLGVLLFGSLGAGTAYRLLLAKRKRSSWIRTKMHLITVLATGILLFVTIQTLRGIEMRSWYYMSLLPILLIITALLLDQLPGNATLTLNRAVNAFSAFRLIVASLLILLGLSLSRLFVHRIGEIDKYKMVQLLNDRVPQTARIGSWNAGLYGYFGNLQVINLDGSVNNEIYRYITTRSVGAYCAKRRIRYLVDPQGALRYGSQFAEPWFSRVIEEAIVEGSVFGEKGDEPILLIDLGEDWWNNAPI